MWQPIKTAPVETPVLVWLPPGSREEACGTFSGEDVRVAVAALREDYFYKYHDWPKEKYPNKWYGDVVEFDQGYPNTLPTVDIELHPTHWMPLPEPPRLFTQAMAIEEGLK